MQPPARCERHTGSLRLSTIQTRKGGRKWKMHSLRSHRPTKCCRMTLEERRTTLEMYAEALLALIIPALCSSCDCRKTPQLEEAAESACTNPQWMS